jgi:hypothetical protein
MKPEEGTMSLEKALKNIKFDKRLTEIHVSRGVLSREEQEKHLKELPDLSHNVELASGEDTDDDSAAETPAPHPSPLSDPQGSENTH